MKACERAIVITDWGLLDYQDAYDRQKALARERMEDMSPDRLIFVEHPPAVTVGRSGSEKDLVLSEDALLARGVKTVYVDRGGKATFHGPGQLVVYTIVKLNGGDVRQYVRDLLKVIADVLRSYGIRPELKDEPGLWVGREKIASIGLALRKGVVYHGVALNVDPDLSLFDCIHPCGQPGATVTSMAHELKSTVYMGEVKERVVENFIRVFGYNRGGEQGHLSTLPPWLRKSAPSQQAIDEMERLLSRSALNTVCQSAHCPNLSECFRRGTATFMILGNRCTRSCRFCAVDKGDPLPVDGEEPARIAQMVQKLGIRHSVITSVTRDDLPDGGAGHFVRTVSEIRRTCPGVVIEVLIPDFRGMLDALRKVFDAAPDVFNHNIETVPRLYPLVRPRAVYGRSIEILRYASAEGLLVKSGIMLGLGETDGEIDSVLVDLKRAGCRSVTIGQYLAPSRDHAPVEKYYHPDEFDRWARRAAQIGFDSVASGPLVRSSYMADSMYANAPASKFGMVCSV